ncbi:peptidase M75, Imelysin [Mesorhizobium sp. NBSH29]|uniref:imelysin family protein n=1 Tax=Mesorhizobium sp. NBSH29 TaxID=2654249 RepID=UPI0018C010AA|nr:imelysin family protein [Mesorhizobium sp. NBSH29]QPC86461.1 peptidase M75, Imelysin [Mesorhizobium sp. NBSH29]
MVFQRLAAAILFALPFLVPSAGASEVDTKAVVTQAIDGFIRPAYSDFHASTEALDMAMGALCRTPSNASLGEARQEFSRAALHWSRVELVRFGPVTVENRLERILFWPDRKGTGLRQVQAALAARDATATDPAQLAQKSVAMQGLGALEFILFGADADTLAETGAEGYRCAYGHAVAGNLQSIAGAVAAEWQEPSGFAGIWTNFGPENPLYRTGDEALTEFLEIFINGLELLRDQRLGAFLADEPQGDRPKQALYWRSQNTGPMLAGMMGGLKSLFDASGIELALPDTASWIASSAEFELNNGMSAASSVTGPIDKALADEAIRGKLVYYGVVTSSLSEIFGMRLTGELDLTAGFSSLDGD